MSGAGERGGGHDTELARSLGLSPGEDAIGFLQSLLQHLPAAVIRLDPDDRVRYVNRLDDGSPPSRLVGKPIWATVTAGNEELIRRTFEEVRSTRTPRSYSVVSRTRPDVPITYETHVAPIDEPDGRVGLILIALDVSAARKRDRELARSQEWLRLAVEGTGVAMWAWDMDTGERTFDERMIELTGRQPDVDNPHDYVDRVVHPDDREHVRQNTARGTAERRFIEDVHRILRPDGDVRWVLAKGGMVMDETGRPRQMVGALVDITEQKQRERELARSQELLQLAAEATGVALWSRDLLTGEHTIDKRMCELTGRPEELNDPEHFLSLSVHPEDRDTAVHQFEDCLGTGEFREATYRIVRPDGEIRWVLAKGNILPDAEGRPARVVGALIDITEQRKVEDRLHQAQKMEAVGSLTAGVAHNFNNMLTVILPSLDLLAPVVPPSHRDLLDDARLTAQRAADMVGQLMTFAGQRHARADEVCDVRAVAEEAVRLCRRTFGGGVRIALHEDGVELPVRGTTNDIQQIVVNLLLNARDALSAERPADPVVQVHVSTAREAPGITSREGAGFASVRVVDNGPGMDEATAARAFDPFFSTKVPLGTGLGLATSLTTAREHGGDLTCRSVPGEGAEFTLWLPLTRQAPTEAPAPEPDPAAAPAGPAHLLLVDDEAAIRRLVARILELHGYRVRTAGSVEAARRILEEGEPFDLVLLDRSMPGGGGQILVPELRQQLPRTPILFFTGEALDDREGAQVDGAILKPVSEPELITAVRGALSAMNGTTN